MFCLILSSSRQNILLLSLRYFRYGANQFFSTVGFCLFRAELPIFVRIDLILIIHVPKVYFYDPNRKSVAITRVPPLTFFPPSCETAKHSVQMPRPYLPLLTLLLRLLIQHQIKFSNGLRGKKTRHNARLSSVFSFLWNFCPLRSCYLGPEL